MALGVVGWLWLAWLLWWLCCWWDAMMPGYTMRWRAMTVYRATNSSSGMPKKREMVPTKKVAFQKVSAGVTHTGTSEPSQYSSKRYSATARIGLQQGAC